jgi:hypothetical protein
MGASCAWTTLSATKCSVVPVDDSPPFVPSSRLFSPLNAPLNVHEKEESSSVLVLLDWNKMGEKHILQEKMQPLDPTNPNYDGLFVFTGSFHQLEYFLLQNTKTRQFIENLNQTNSKTTSN